MTLLFWTWSTELNNFFIPSVVLKACTQPSVFPEINATICLTDTSNSWETKEKTCCKSITFSLERLEQSARDGIAAILFSLIWDSTDDHFFYAPTGFRSIAKAHSMFSAPHVGFNSLNQLEVRGQASPNHREDTHTSPRSITYCTLLVQKNI